MTGVEAALLSTGLATLIAVLAATWRLATKIATLDAKVTPLMSLPERVAKVEQRVEDTLRARPVIH
jgi:hypothetical protein